MKLNLKGLFDEPEIDGFVESLEKGVIQKKFPPTIQRWRVSSLVKMWCDYSGKAREDRLYRHLQDGNEEDFETGVLKRFDLGHKVHDIVKEYFEASPDFKVIKNEWGITHPTLPIGGTMDHIVEWNKYPGREFVVEIKSVESEYHNNQYWGSKIKPFKKARWQAGIYGTIYGAQPIVVYYCKDNSELVAHLLQKSDYQKDVEAIFATCEKVWNKFKDDNNIETSTD